MITQLELSRRWGLSRPAIHALVKRGMPLTSEDAAMRWRVINKRGQKLKGRNIPKPKQVRARVNPAAASASESPQDDDERYSGMSTLRRCQQAEVAAFNAMAQCLMPKSPSRDQFKMMLNAHAAAVAAKGRAERDLKDQAVANGTLMLFDDAVGRFGEIMARLRTLVDGLPAQCGPRCNPTDPQLATMILNEWVQQFLAVMSHGESSTISSKAA